MTIKAIIWDLEGVLLRTKDSDVSVSLAKRLDVPVDKVWEIFHGEFNDRMDMGEFSQNDFWNHILDTLGKPHSDKIHLLDFFYQDLYVDPDVLDDIRRYRRSCKIGLLSNYSEILRPMLQNQWNLIDEFDEIVISSEVKMIKPHADIFNYMLGKIGCEAHEAIFVDDRLPNVKGAEEVGMSAIHFTNRDEVNREIEQILTENGTAF
jgi:HAD superfamily hydrolase (TIGR01509 family)